MTKVQAGGSRVHRLLATVQGTCILYRLHPHVTNSPFPSLLDLDLMILLRHSQGWGEYRKDPAIRVRSSVFSLFANLHRNMCGFRDHGLALSA